MPPLGVQVTLQRLRKSLRSCYERHLCGNETLCGMLELSVWLSPAGRVTRVEGHTARPELRELVPCLAHKLRAAQFPPPAEGQEFMLLPLLFDPGERPCR